MVRPSHFIPAVTVLLLFVQQWLAVGGELRMPLRQGAGNVLEFRLESLAEQIRREGFPRFAANGKPVAGVWVEDIDGNGQCSSLDNVVVILNSPAPRELTLVFDQASRPPPLITGREVKGTYVETTPAYQATVVDQGGRLQRLANAAGIDLLHAPLQYRLWTGGFCRPDGVMDVSLSQAVVQARLFLFESPARKTLVCRYNLDETACPTNLGPLTAGLKGLTIYKFYPDRLAVENRLFETANNNFPYLIRASFELAAPQAVFDSFFALNRLGEKVVTGVIASPDQLWEKPIANLPAWLCFKGPQAKLGIVFDRPGWQAAQVIDARRPKWGNFIAVDTYFDGLANQFWFVVGDQPEQMCGELAQPAIPRDFFRAAPAFLTQLHGGLYSARAAIGKIPAGRWTLPAEVQLESANVFAAMAGQCWKVDRPLQARRLAETATAFAERASVLAWRAETEKWPDPGLKNRTEQPAFTNGFYWPWYGCKERTEQRAEYARTIGINCVHSMDIQGWPEIEASNDSNLVTTADFRPTLDFLDLLQRKKLRGIFLTMDPMYPAWAKRLPFTAAPQAFRVVPPELQKQAEWVTTYVNRTKGHPALAGYVIHNEPGAATLDAKDPMVKWAFVQWLKNRHGTLDTVNRNWRTHYQAWEDIPVPNLQAAKLLVPGTVTQMTETVKIQYSNTAICYDFVLFEQESFAGYLSWLSDIAAKADPSRPVFSKVCDANLGQSYSTGDPWKFKAAQRQIYGANFYYGPQHGALGGGIGNMNLMLPFGIDMENDATSLPVWCTEFNQGWWKPYCLPQPGAFRVQAWTSLGKGLRGLFPYSWTPGQWATFNGDDSPTPVAEAACQFYAQVKALDPVIAGFRKPAPGIAFYYARPSFYHRDLASSNHPERPLSTPFNQLRSLYEAVALVGGFPVTFLPDEEIARGELKRVRVLMVAEGDYMPDETLSRIRDFVVQGGTLVTIGSFARFNEYGFPTTFDVPGLIGATAMPATPSAVSGSGRIMLYPPREKEIPAIAFSRLQPAARVLGSFADQQPAIIEFAQGKGRVLSIGIPAGVATDAVPGATAEFFTRYLVTQGVKPSAQVTGGLETSRNDFAMVGLKDAHNSDWLILANAGPYPVAPSIQWHSPTPRSGQVMNLLTGDVYPCTPDRQEVIIRLGPYEVALIGKLQTP